MVKVGNVKVGLVNTGGVIDIKIINGVGLFSETGNAVTWDGVHYEQQVVNTISYLFSFRGSAQDYKIRMDMEIVKLT